MMGQILVTCSVKNVCERNERNVFHVPRRVVERMPEALDGLLAVALDAPEQRGRGAQHPRSAVRLECQCNPEKNKSILKFD